MLIQKFDSEKPAPILDNLKYVPSKSRSSMNRPHSYHNDFDVRIHNVNPLIKMEAQINLIIKCIKIFVLLNGI